MGDRITKELAIKAMKMAIKRAVAENFFSNMKCECTNFYSFNTRSEAKQIIFEYIEIYYNRQRKHSACGWIPPKKYKQLLMSKAT